MQLTARPCTKIPFCLVCKFLADLFWKDDWRISVCLTSATAEIDSAIDLRRISELVSFAALWDPLLIYTLKRTSFNLDSDQQSFLVALMVACIPVSKMVKIFLIAQGSLTTCIST
ncbi:hypothetical protein INS49_003550 [Diaporthe citri]|uniref:uncharacterized protein n=1 Tax=Diaporthe citri TaxID=83186 RepID=UPI001C821EC1|nr:uncharacterized protein INS49_003550 [Diaporthe citri]KAG6355588.1 hypothetical protein INS49_003550 [Diaporthe citri]